MRRLVLQKVRGTLGSVEDRTIGVLGLAFKPNTDDLRESPAIEIIHLLQSEGARVKAYDPAANAVAASVLPGVELCSDAYAVAEGADALILVTPWSEFRRVDLERVRQSMRYPLLVDGRNLYDPTEMVAKGFFYQPIGRPVAEQSVSSSSGSAASSSSSSSSEPPVASNGETPAAVGATRAA
jgi:UDPglucose 6-dehydrogenase